MKTNYGLMAYSRTQHVTGFEPSTNSLDRTFPHYAYRIWLRFCLDRNIKASEHMTYLQNGNRFKDRWEIRWFCMKRKERKQNRHI